MAFINGLEVNDATGRAKIDLDQALPGAGAASLGGWLYNNAVTPNRLQVDDSANFGPPVPSSGFLLNQPGQVQILQSLPGGAPLFNNGVRVGQFGAIAISAGGPIVNYVHGWPVTIDGALCIE